MLTASPASRAWIRVQDEAGFPIHMKLFEGIIPASSCEVYLFIYHMENTWTSEKSDANVQSAQWSQYLRRPETCRMWANILR